MKETTISKFADNITSSADLLGSTKPSVLFYPLASLLRGLICGKQEEMYRVIDDYPPLNWEYESSCICHPYPQVEIVPPGLIPKRENTFLFRKN